ncbi:MAG: MBL fold metallo-hydrolase [Nitrososphaerales archaeon]|nr:MBL fold metallo-hydrolase [Nitrososphaerales archaeon]
MIFAQVKVGHMENFSYIIGDDKTHLGVIIDPGFDTEKILNKAFQMKLTIKYLIDTHEHPDHISGNIDLSEKTGAKIVAHKDAKIKKDLVVKDEEIISIGETNIKVLHTPGHSPGSICLLVDNKLITGDTLFVGECGRIDLPGGNAEDLYHSFFDKILNISDNVEVYPGHDYGLKPFSSIGFERKHNYVLRPRTKEEFVRFMKNP